MGKGMGMDMDGRGFGVDSDGIGPLESDFLLFFGFGSEN